MLSRGKKVCINHNNGANLYVATANATTGRLRLPPTVLARPLSAPSNPNVVAEVNGKCATSFKDAVNAVANGGTVEIVGGNKNYTATISEFFQDLCRRVKIRIDSDITV